MTKKIILALFLFISFFGVVNNGFADGHGFIPPPIDSSLDGSDAYQEQQQVAADKAAADKAAADKAAADKAEHEKKCAGSGDCLDQSSFTINTSKFSPIGKMIDKKNGTELKNTEQKINFILGTIIQKLMIALGVLSVLIMTVGGGYIIMYHGQDELLSKGKSIFMSGVIALVVALSSYYLVSTLRFILYN